MTPIRPLSLLRNRELDDPPKSVENAVALARARFDEALDLVLSRGDESISFMALERELREHVFAVARALVVVFLVVAEQRITETLPENLKFGARRFLRGPLQARSVTTMFGVVRYARMYLRESIAGQQKKKLNGFHPLDAALGLGADRFTMTVLAFAARMATKMSYADAKSTSELTMPVAPSTEVIQQTVLGFGNYTSEWFELRPSPSGDGEILVIMIDSKGVPTAGEQELLRRRRPRKKEEKAPSPRHRGRKYRHRYTKRPRKKKGDCSKNARMANMIVMYTLKREGGLLLGPINRWIHASFATKEHAFQIARREANKRGFTSGSGKLVQFVTDGDLDLGRKIAQFFPEATQTIDFIHVVEKLWDAGTAIFEEGTREHRAWYAEQHKRLLGGECHLILQVLVDHDRAIPRTGPGNKGRHQRLHKAISYIAPRLEQMDYASIIAQDLEFSTGQVEGIIKNVIAKRCDHGGMRWILERVEALLQLRCIEINGDWDAFVSHVHDARMYDAQSGERSSLLTREAKPIPTTRNAEAHRRCRCRKAQERDAYLAGAA